MEKSTLNYFRQESDRELLQKRAEKLAQRISDPGTAEEQEYGVKDCVFFRMGGDVYGLEASLVKEVMEPEFIVPVPCTPAFHRGVVSVRGHIWAVIDLCEFLGTGRPLESSEPGIILLSGEGVDFCIAVDEILDVQSVPGYEIKPLAEGEDRVSKYSLGVTGDRKTVLDGRAILREQTFVVNEFVGSI